MSRHRVLHRHEVQLDGVESEIRRLLDAGKCKQAVEAAKDHHKRAATDDSRRLLFQAYKARIEQFYSKGMAQEARTLLTLVQERFPEERHELEAAEIRCFAEAGDLDNLLRPLGSDQTSPQKRELIETVVSQRVTDLPAVAACGSLPADHLLRSGAAAVWAAFEAVTSGPVSDAQVALPDISRRSPFSAWKMLIRAVAAFYQMDDAGCRRALDAIPADSAVAGAAAGVRAMVDGIKPKGGAAAVLFDRVRVDDKALRESLASIDFSFKSYSLRGLSNAIRDAIRLCTAARPELLDRVRQHISVACMLHEVPASSVVAAMGLPIADAYFWRLLSRANEIVRPPAVTAMSWERFIRHAVDEKMFGEGSPEAAAVWLHIAELLSPLSLRQLERDRGRVERLGYITPHYKNQKTEIARLRPASEKALIESVLGPGEAFRHAAAIRGDAETFAKWWAWAERVDLPAKQKEDVAVHWHRSRPRDVEPLVNLSALAESRNALSLALKRLAEAEAVDPLNQKVRQARVRLTLAITWRHFADGKPHLVQKDIAELAALPGMGDGDRGAVLEAIRSAWHGMRGDSAAENASFQIVADRIGFVAATMLTGSIKRLAKQPGVGITASLTAEDKPVDVATAQAKVIRICDDLNLPIYVPQAWSPIILTALGEKPCPLAPADLLALGRAAMGTSQMEAAYLGSAAGLARKNPPATTARFLLQRAKCLKEPWQDQRAVQCLRASLALARQAHEQVLIDQIFAVVDRDARWDTVGNVIGGPGLTADVLQRVVDAETKAETFPSRSRANDPFVIPAAASVMMPGFGGFDDADSDWDDDDDEDDDEEVGDADCDSFDPFPDPVGLSPKELKRLEQLLREKGVSSVYDLLENPTAMVEAMSKLLGKDIVPDEFGLMDEAIVRLFGSAGDRPVPGGTGKHRNKKRK